MFQSVDLILLFYYTFKNTFETYLNVFLSEMILPVNIFWTVRFLKNSLLPTKPAFIWLKINNYSSLPCHMILYKSL